MYPDFRNEPVVTHYQPVSHAYPIHAAQAQAQVGYQPPMMMEYPTCGMMCPPYHFGHYHPWHYYQPMHHQHWHPQNTQMQAQVMSLNMPGMMSNF